MKGDTPPPGTGGPSPQRRRSARLSFSPLTGLNVDKMAPLAAVKRSIVVKKIAPRKTVLPSEHDKENVRRLSEEDLTKKPKISTPDPVHVQGRKKAAMPSPILPSPRPSSPSPPPSHPSSPPPPQPTAAPEDALWSNKVRRSYSRLSDQSIHSPNGRENLFGFEKLTTPEVCNKALSRSGTEGSCYLSALSSFSSLIDAEECVSADVELDLNIPGVVMAKERKKRRKVQKIDAEEIDNLAAQMNAEFEEAECFELLVE